MAKERLTISLDREILEAGAAAVAEGRADSMSAWVSDALADRIVRQRRLDAMADAIAAYEAEHGAFTDEELADLARRDRDAAAALRAKHDKRSRGAA
jgi:hypothetical protein